MAKKGNYFIKILLIFGSEFLRDVKRTHKTPQTKQKTTAISVAGQENKKKFFFFFFPISKFHEYGDA